MDKAPSILMVAPDFGVAMGGIGRVALSLARGLTDAGFSPTVLARENYDDQRRDPDEPFAVHRYPPRPRPLELLTIVSRTKRLARELQPDYLLLNHWFPAAFAARRLARRGGPPYLVVVHGFEVLEPWRRGGWKKRLLLPALKGAAGFLVLSDYNRRLLEEELKLNVSIHKVRPGFAPEAFAANEVVAERAEKLRRRWALEGRRILLSVGRLIERKGFADVVRALPAIREKVPEVLYLAAGGWPGKEELAELARSLGVADNVRLPGFVAEEDLPALYSLGEAFVMPAREIPERGQVEGFGLVYLEANAAGLPVVGARSGGVPEAIRDGVTGLLVEPGNVPALTGALLRLLTDRDLARRLGNAGRQRVLIDFSPEACRDSLRWAFKKNGWRPGGSLAAPAANR